MTLTADMTNGLLELMGSFMIWANVRRLYIDKQVKGISVWGTLFFFTWGIWNLFYYPGLQQWYSFWGGICIMVANSAWLGLLVYYKSKQK